MSGQRLQVRSSAGPRVKEAERRHGARTDDVGLVLELQRTAGNAAVARLLRQRSAGHGHSGPMSRDDFATAVARFGVATVREGTLENQVELLNASGDGVGDVLTNDIREHHFPWSPWSPGASSATYASIAAGLEDFGHAARGLPPLEEIVFFEYPIEPLTLEGRPRVRRRRRPSSEIASSSSTRTPSSRRATRSCRPAAIGPAARAPPRAPRRTKA